ncbi:phosphatidylglycerol lysyltransferase domain-containing protein [Aliiroseovarius sp. PTFE2010]|uniref:phosphatidylglycerol lysyltransferase domain-containing protein n=1 Tax=Aliiroseovarius sp. PTFE2010 TaxID=3417190 RepID=UPI003CEFBE76
MNKISPGFADRQVQSQSESVRESGARTQLRSLLWRQLVLVGLVIVMGAVMWDHAKDLDFASIRQSLGTIPPRQWALALIASACSFWIIGRYDAVLHRQMGTGVARAPAQRAGIVSIAIAQAVGMGAVTGTLVRWRMLPDMTLWQVVRLSMAVSLSFLAGWAVVAAAMAAVVHPELSWVRIPMLIAGGIVVVMVALSIWPPKQLARLPLPSWRAMGEIAGLVLLDCTLAGLALYALLPPDLHVPLPLLLSTFFFAMGAGLLGATPGGIGPFEVTLIALMPNVPTEPLLAAALGFRIVYHIIPAVIAAGVAIRGPRGNMTCDKPGLTRVGCSAFLPPRLEALLFASPRAEVNLLRQGEFSLLTTPDGKHLALAAPIGQSLVMLCDPMTKRGCPHAARDALRLAARNRYLLPAVYKCGARMAVAARQAGWAVLPVAREAWLKPDEFTLDGSKRRQLRRMLRKAQEAGLTTSEAGRDLPLADMKRLADEWRKARGGERGFSMGAYDADYVTCQRVFVGHVEGKLVAFATFHETRNEITLDLMRNTSDAPEGTMHALVVAAIENAGAYGCPRVSLASTQWDGDDANALVGRLRARLQGKSGAAGLMRFKRAFAPNWETLYAAAPTRIGLIVAGLGILRRITAPPRRAGNAMRVLPARARSRTRAGDSAAVSSSRDTGRRVMAALRFSQKD